MAGLVQFLGLTAKLCLQRAAKSDTHFANTVFGVFIGMAPRGPRLIVSLNLCRNASPSLNCAFWCSVFDFACARHTRFIVSNRTRGVNCLGAFGVCWTIQPLTNFLTAVYCRLEDPGNA